MPVANGRIRYNILLYAVVQAWLFHVTRDVGMAGGGWLDCHDIYQLELHNKKNVKTSRDWCRDGALSNFWIAQWQDLGIREHSINSDHQLPASKHFGCAFAILTSDHLLMWLGLTYNIILVCLQGLILHWHIRLDITQILNYSATNARKILIQHSLCQIIIQIYNIMQSRNKCMRGWQRDK